MCSILILMVCEKKAFVGKKEKFDWKNKVFIKHEIHI